MDARDKRETTNTHLHKKKIRRESLVVSTTQAAENECWKTRRGKKKRKRERETWKNGRRTREMEKAFWNFENFFFSF